VSKILEETKILGGKGWCNWSKRRRFLIIWWARARAAPKSTPMIIISNCYAFLCSLYRKSQCFRLY